MEKLNPETKGEYQNRIFDSFDSDFAQCPHCIKIIKSEDYKHIDPGETQEFECKSCGKIIVCSCELNYTFEMREWEQTIEDKSRRKRNVRIILLAVIVSFTAVSIFCLSVYWFIEMNFNPLTNWVLFMIFTYLATWGLFYVWKHNNHPRPYRRPRFR